MGLGSYGVMEFGELLVDFGQAVAAVVQGYSVFAAVAPGRV